MTAVERRFLAGFREVDTDTAGLVQEDDDTIWLVAPDGTRTQLPGGGGAIPDPITTPVTIAPTDPTDVNLTLQAAGVAGDEDQVIDVVQGDGVHTVYADTGGAFTLRWATNADGGFAILDEDGTHVFQLDKGNGTLRMGFFGHAKAAQPAAPVTLGDVIAALQTLGLVGV